MIRDVSFAAFREWIARLWSLFRCNRSDQDLERELIAHLELAEDDLRRSGHSSPEARRLARVRFGSPGRALETLRDQRGVPWLGGLGLDVKLGLRVLRKSWGLTLVAGLAMSVVIAIATASFHVCYPLLWGELPLDEGDRVVTLITWNATTQQRRSPSSSDFERWRETLRSVGDVSAFRSSEHSLAFEAGSAGLAAGAAPLASVAEMSASGFILARVPPLLGRALRAHDELEGAEPVVVIGYDVWQSQFASEPTALGRTVGIDGVAHTVVGVMPRGFNFPVNHSFWTPLPVGRLDETQGSFVFARLRPEATLEGAHAELATLGLLPLGMEHAANERITLEVMPYTLGILDIGDPVERVMVSVGLFLIGLLLVPPCANIAILIYARTVARQQEFATRCALGAGRARIVGQLFVELLMLAAIAAALALVLLQLGLDQGLLGSGQSDPFWVDYSAISLPTGLFATGLAVLAAVIAGVIPALQATGSMMQSGLRAASSRTGLQLGATWTALVVAQVATSVAFLPAALEMTWGSLRPSVVSPGFEPREFLTAKIAWPSKAALNEGTQSPATGPGIVNPRERLLRLLESEPGILSITASAYLPGIERGALIEIEKGQGEPPQLGGRSPLVPSLRAGVNHVDDAFLRAYEVPLLVGRQFSQTDAGRAVIVNRTFAQRAVGDGNALGRRIRRVDGDGAVGRSTSEPGPWLEIVGVVADRPATSATPKVYHLAGREEIYPLSLSLHLGADPAGVASRLREIAATVDPALRVKEVLLLNEVYRRHQWASNLPMACLIGAVTLSVLLLSVAGLNALLSFTVVYRRREIGIRSALGAQPHYLLRGVFRRCLSQVAIGALAGLLVAMSLDHFMLGLELEARGLGFRNVPGVVPAAAILMLLVGLLSGVGPARRALGVEPTEALREG